MFTEAFVEMESLDTISVTTKTWNIYVTKYYAAALEIRWISVHKHGCIYRTHHWVKMASCREIQIIRYLQCMCVRMPVGKDWKDLHQRIPVIISTRREGAAVATGHQASYLQCFNILQDKNLIPCYFKLDLTDHRLSKRIQRHESILNKSLEVKF